MIDNPITIDDHVVQQARQCPSPNQDERPDMSDISLLVIHGISLPPDQFGAHYIDQLFQNNLDPKDHPYFLEICHLRVSTHLLIRRDGEIVQYVPFHQRAWHAGLSQFDGRETCNDFSIGIELEGTDSIPYTDKQYACLADITKLIMKQYPKITADRIAGHCHIAPGRKTDPGPIFQWDRYFSAIGFPTPPHVNC